MNEKQLEQKLTKAVKQRGGQAWKLTSPGLAGAPDRLILLPKGRHGFIETKTTGQKPRPIQTKRHQDLKQLGHPTYVIDHPNQIKETLDAIQTTQLPD